MVGIVAALYDEVFSVLPYLNYRRIDKISQYNGIINGCDVSLFLTKPGIQKISNFKKWLEQHNFKIIINIGFTGALTNQFKLGDCLDIKKIISLNKENLYLNSKSLLKKQNYTLITVNQPVFSINDKEDYQFEYKADLADMEAYKLLNASLAKGFSLNQWYVIKIVGDLPGDEYFLKNEVLFRNFFTSRGIMKKIKIIYETGFLNSWHFYKRKRFLQKILKDFLFNHVPINID
ncbi:MAG: hypothetical protein OEZ22_01570 [Spirochaetia bacterium]|nr:hypothetical protein [Spirochaetia bacterium]